MSYRSVNPATGEVLKTFTEHTDQEMMDALATADKAFASWAARPIKERAETISYAAQLLFERKSELARLATLEMGSDGIIAYKIVSRSCRQRSPQPSRPRRLFLPLPTVLPIGISSTYSRRIPKPTACAPYESCVYALEGLTGGR